MRDILPIGVKHFSCEGVIKREKGRGKVLEFYEENGLKVALKYEKIKRVTLYKWQKRYKEFGIYGLQNGDRRPKRKRQSNIEERIRGFIKEYR